jgi:hypothetical protein
MIPQSCNGGIKADIALEKRRHVVVEHVVERSGIVRKVTVNIENLIQIHLHFRVGESAMYNIVSFSIVEVVVMLDPQGNRTNTHRTPHTDLIALNFL